MRQNTVRPEVRGTRSGYVIRYTCPACATENIIVCKMPRDYYRETHEANCRHCRNRLTVLTPGHQNRNASEASP